MNIFLEQGRFDAATLSTASGAGGNTAVNLRPPENEAWLIVWAVAYNNEGGKAQYWQLKGCSTDPLTLSDSTPAINARVPLYIDYAVAHLYSPYRMPLRLTYDQYVLTYANLAAAKTIYIDYIAYKIRAWGRPANE